MFAIFNSFDWPVLMGMSKGVRFFWGGVIFMWLLAAAYLLADPYLVNSNTRVNANVTLRYNFFDYQSIIKEQAIGFGTGIPTEKNGKKCLNGADFVLKATLASQE